MRRLAFLIATLLSMGGVLAAEEPRIDLAKDDAGKIWFASAGSIVKGADASRYVVSNEPVTVSGELQFPEGGGPFPVVVLAHTCAGPGYSELTWVARLRKWGYATFVVDSLGPRGIGSVCNDPWRLVPFQRVPDVYGALRILATHPKIDVSNAFLAGFSHGGNVAMNAATVWARDIYAPALPRQVNIAVWVVITIVALIFYIPITFIVLRNTPFRPILTYCFSLTVVPMFVSLLVFSVFAVGHWAPSIAAFYNWAQQFGPPGRGGGRIGGIASTLIYLPIPVAGTAIWAWLFWYLDRKLPGNTRKDAT